ncbi:MAG TPA: HNH endonuclease, partial [Candidatus Goldiibacteriota bacterium]|nr:HNH endonuclease [Candidatus Goldiibacteriota bacterium]
MNFYIGVTDKNWYEYQKAKRFDEVNFWQPRDTRAFTVIKPGELFLFKLHYPENYIVGGGILVRQTVLPMSLTWEVFENKNGMDTAVQFESSIYRLRRTNRREDADPKVGSIILSQPFFMEQKDWIPMDGIWDKNIVQGKTFDGLTEPGRTILEKIRQKVTLDNAMPVVAEEQARYGAEQVVKPRLGQAGFRVEVIEVYHRRCAVTGEKT